MAGGGAESGGRKLSGAEKNAFNQQSGLLVQEQARLEALQAALYNLQPKQFELLGIDPRTGRPISPTDRGSAPAPVKNPGATIDDFLPKNRWNTSEGDKINYQEAKNKYENYKLAKKRYDTWKPNGKDSWPEPQEQRRLENKTIQDVLSGKLSPAAAMSQGKDQGQGAILAQLLNYSSGLARTKDNETKQLIGQFGDRLATGLRGDKPVNPQIERELAMREDAMRNRMQHLQGPGWETSSAGIETLGDFGRQRAGVIDQLNQQDIAQALQGYSGLTQLNSDELSRALSQYTGLTSSGENLRMQQYINEMQRRTGLAGLYTGTVTQPLTGVSYAQLAQAYGQQASAQTAAQQGPGGGGGGAGQGAAIGGLVGTVGGGIAGSFFGGVGAVPGAMMGGAVGTMAGGLIGGQMGGGGAGGGGGGNPFPVGMMAGNLGGGGGGGGYIAPQGQTYYGNQGGYAMGNFGMSRTYGY